MRQPRDDTSRDDPTDNLVELERAKIGHEIHDALLPLIFAASSGVQSAINGLPEDADQSRQQLTQTLQWLTNALQTGRRMLTEIYPPELIGSLWVRAAKDTVERLFADSSPRIVWDTEESVEQTSQEIAVTIYRIVVEAIRNSIRHGQADQDPGSSHSAGRDHHGGHSRRRLRFRCCRNSRGSIRYSHHDWSSEFDWWFAAG